MNYEDIQNEIEYLQQKIWILTGRKCVCGHTFELHSEKRCLDLPFGGDGREVDCLCAGYREQPEAAK